MKETLKLALAYQKRHKKQFFTSAFCIAFFVAAMFSMQLFQTCFDAWQQQLWAEKYGAFELAFTNVDLSKAEKTEFKTDGAFGFMAAVQPIVASDAPTHLAPYLGFMDETCVKLLSASMVEGSLPTEEGQAAVEETAYQTLGLSAKVGETFTLSITEENGETKEQSFILTGIVSSYLQTWQNASYYIDKHIPTVITVPGDVLPIGHILFEKPIEGTWPEGLVADGAGFYNTDYGDSTHDSQQLKIMGSVLTALFVFLLVVGIVNVVNILLAARGRYTSLLRCVGATKDQAYQVFLWQGLLLTTAALVFGCGLGSLLLWLAVASFRALGFHFPFVLKAWPILLVLGISAVAILVPYQMQVRRFLRGEPLHLSNAQIRRKNRKMGKGNFASVWLRAKRPALRAQNLLTILLAGGCMVLMAFGPFYADYIAYGSYKNLEGEMDNIGMDYWMGLANGGQELNHLLVESPRNKGVPADMVKKFGENQNLKVDFSAVTVNSAARLLTSQHDTVSPAGRLRSDYSVLRVVEDDKKSTYLSDKGYPSGSDVLAYPIFGVSSDQVAALGQRKTSGNFDKAAYDAGTQVVAVGDDFQVGDKVTITVPSYPADFPLNVEDNRKPELHDQTVTVAAVYHLDYNGSIAEKRLLRARDKMLLFSDKVLLQYDPYGNYDDVCISLANTNISETEKVEIKDLLTEAKTKSRSVTLWDREEMEQEKEELMWQLKLPYLFMIALFLVAVIAALSLSTSLKAKSNLRSFALLRSIGLDDKQLNRLLFYSNFRPCLLGMGVGTVLGLGLCVFLEQTAGLSAPQYYLQTVLPAVLIGGVCIILFCALACWYPKKWIMKQNIMSSIQGVTY